MAREIKAKTVLRLSGQGLSGRAIAGSLGIARQGVAETLDAAKAAGVGWDDAADKSDDEACARLFPGRDGHGSVCERPVVFLDAWLRRRTNPDRPRTCGPCRPTHCRGRVFVFNVM